MAGWASLPGQVAQLHVCLQEIFEVDVSPKFQIFPQEGKKARPRPSDFSIPIFGLGDKLRDMRLELVAISVRRFQLLTELQKLGWKRRFDSEEELQLQRIFRLQEAGNRGEKFVDNRHFAQDSRLQSGRSRFNDSMCNIITSRQYRAEIRRFDK